MPNIIDQVNLLDAAGTVFFQRELEAVKSKSYDVLYPELMYDKAFDVSSDTPSGAQEIVYHTYDQRGRAKIVKGAANDIPRVDVDSKETRIPVRPFATSFGYTIDDIEAAQYAGKPLEQKKVNAARRAIEEQMNYVTWYGDADSGLNGFFSLAVASTIPKAVAATDSDSDGTEWIYKTAAEMLADINAAFTAIFTNSKGVERGNRLGLPLTQWNYIMTTNMGTGTDTTIAQYIIQNSPYLTSLDQILPIPELSAYTAGVAALMVWTKNPDKIQVEIPMDVTFMAPQLTGLEYLTIARAKFAGLNCFYPLSAYLVYGI